MLVHFRPGLAAVRLYYRALLFFPVAGLLLVWFYYHHPAFRSWCAQAALWKSNGGPLLVAVASITIGLLLPEFAKFVTGQWHGGSRYFSRILFAAGFFGLIGIIVDLFYRLQALWLGDSSSWEIVATKVFIDQFLFTPFVSLPFAILWFVWGEEKLHPARTWRRLRPSLIGERMLPLLLPCWVFWVPMVACVYALPASLQFLLYLCANGAWGLLFLAISKEISGERPLHQ